MDPVVYPRMGAAVVVGEEVAEGIVLERTLRAHLRGTVPPTVAAVIAGAAGQGVEVTGRKRVVAVFARDVVGASAAAKARQVSASSSRRGCMALRVRRPSVRVPVLSSTRVSI